MSEKGERPPIPMKKIELEKGVFVDYKDLHGISITNTNPSGWLEVTIEGGYNCGIKLEQNQHIAKLTVTRDGREILSYDRGGYDEDITEEGRVVEAKIKEIFSKE